MGKKESIQQIFQISLAIRDMLKEQRSSSTIYRQFIGVFVDWVIDTNIAHEVSNTDRLFQFGNCIRIIQVNPLPPTIPYFDELIIIVNSNI